MEAELAAVSLNYEKTKRHNEPTAGYSEQEHNPPFMIAISPPIFLHASSSDDDEIYLPPDG